jgi:hypothetical protein
MAWINSGVCEPTPASSFSPKGLPTNLTSHETGVTLVTLMTQEFPSFPIKDSLPLGPIKVPQGTAGPAQKYYLDRWGNIISNTFSGVVVAVFGEIQS